MIGQRLEELMKRDQVNAELMVAEPIDELKRRQLRIDDDLEDFFDEGVVNKSGAECPFALKLLACQLLLEITTFLRENFQYLPRARGEMKPRGSSAWERLMTHKRWSIISSTFNPSQHSASGSIQSIANIVDVMFRKLFY